MKPPGLLVLDVVGLTPGLIGDATPHLKQIASRGVMGPLECPFPALTLSSQASLLTGTSPASHGIVGNGWYFKELAEPLLWRQPYGLLQTPDIIETLRAERPGFRVAKLFWWFNMYAPVDVAVTPRPMYPADGRKVPDIHTHPPELRDSLQSSLGRFPLFHFWGPAADLRSSDWIARCAEKILDDQRPNLTLVYLPHLDYDFQRFGPDHPISTAALRAVDGLVGKLANAANHHGMRVLVVSEYGIVPVHRPVHPNRILREAGWLAVRDELGLERLDYGACRGFALADHQIAHVYLRSTTDLADAVRLFQGVPGIESVLFGASRAAAGLDHERAGDLILVAERDAWFTYYFWTDDARAPDYARTVDIHRKPGYDPAELMLDPHRAFPKARIIRRLVGKKLGFRNLMDVIGLDPAVVRGSHGRLPDHPSQGPILLGSHPIDGWDGSRPFPFADFPKLLATWTR